MADVAGSKRVVVAKERLPMAAKLQRELKRRILKGVYPPHQYLPPERDLAKNLRTSRVTVGKALEALQRDGLVLRTPGRGTRVLPLSKRPSQPTIGIIRGKFALKEQVAREDASRTLKGVTDTLDRLDCDYELMSVTRPHDMTADQFMARFGAMIFVEGYLGDVQQLAEFERRKVPVVIAKLEEDVEVCATWVDHSEPMRQAVQNFVSLGHRRIAFIGREETFGIHGKARQGYLKGLEESGVVDIDESLIGVCKKTDSLSGYLATKSVLQLTDPPTAIVAARDSIAEGVVHAIEEADLIVGQHVSVIGFDDTTWPEGREFLSTFREAGYAMGEAAAEMLVERILNGWMPMEKRKFETPFVLRRTAAPPPGAYVTT